MTSEKKMEKIIKRPQKLFYHLPPTAVPILGSDVKSAVRGMFDHDRYVKDFVSELKNTIGSNNCFLTTSGRAALLLILLTLKSRSDRLEVILPAYTCPTVFQAVIEAGLQPLFCDVDPRTLGFDRDHLSHLLSEKVLSIVPTHLYGLAQDITDLVGICGNLGIYIVEDAAQAFGALVSGKMVGCTGDFGLFSMGFGKSLPIGDGGVICTKDSFVADLEKTLTTSKTQHSKWSVISLGEFLVYALATTPAGWWAVFRSPWNPAKKEMQINFLPEIEVGEFNAVQAGIGKSILKRINKINMIRRDKANSLKEILAGIEFVNLPEIASNTAPIYLRFPVIADTKTNADELYRQLSKAGIGVSKSYTFTLPDLFSDASFLKAAQFHGARRLANCLLTLPTHPYVKADDLVAVQRIFESFGT